MTTRTVNKKMVAKAADPITDEPGAHPVVA